MADFNVESSSFFEEAMRIPRPNLQASMAKSSFKVPRRVFNSVLKAPTLDEEAKWAVDSSRRQGPTKAAVHKWEAAVDASYESHMACFRLAHHNSLMATYLDAVASDLGHMKLSNLAKFQMELSQDTLKSAAYGAASDVHLRRSMALGQTDELAAGPLHDKIMALPFYGENLFGPGFMKAIEKASESQEKCSLLRSQMKIVSQGSRAYVPACGRGRGFPASRRGAQRGARSATVTSSQQAAQNFPQQPFRGNWGGRGGRGAARGGPQRGTFRGRGPRGGRKPAQ